MDTSEITSVEWCFGYGGIHLGLKRVIPNLRLLAACEIEAYACANVVAKMEAGLLDPAPIWTDLKTFPCELFRDRVDLFIAGYPCQPFSHAGQRKGADDPRHLWPSIKDGIQTMRPLQCFFENVEGHISLGLREVLTDLAQLGYRVENDRKEPTWGIFSATEVGAPHVRKRVFILAQLENADVRQSEFNARRRAGCSNQSGARPHGQPSGSSIQLANAESGARFGTTSGANGHASFTSENVANPGSARCERHQQSSALHGDGGGRQAHGSAPQFRGVCLPEFPPGPDDLDAWRAVIELYPSLEPSICRLAYGGPSRVDELRLAGNGVLPATAERAYTVLDSRMNHV